MAMHSRFFPPTARRASGFTVVELVVTVAIASILLAFAAPSFVKMNARGQVRALGSDLQVTLLRARSEAIARNANVSVVPKSGSWQNGWQILDPATNTAIEDRNAGHNVTATGPASVIFNPSGRLAIGSVAPTFVFTASNDSSTSSCVTVDLSGRPYAKLGATC